MHDALDWVAENHKLLVRSGLVALVALAGGGAASVFLDHRHEAATNALAEAMETLDAPVVAEGADNEAGGDGERFTSEAERRAAAKERLDAVHERMASGAAGDVAGLLLAGIEVQDGDAERARALWQNFADSHQGHMLAVVARLNLITLDRQQGRTEEVADELRSELESGHPSLPEDMLLFELARTLEDLGRKDEARIYFQQLVDEHAGSPYAAEARQRTTGAAA